MRSGGYPGVFSRRMAHLTCLERAATLPRLGSTCMQLKHLWTVRSVVPIFFIEKKLRSDKKPPTAVGTYWIHYPRNVIRRRVSSARVFGPPLSVLGCIDKFKQHSNSNKRLIGSPRFDLQTSNVSRICRSKISSCRTYHRAGGHLATSCIFEVDVGVNLR